MSGTNSPDIVIRPYGNEDQEHVFALFRRGMMSLVPTFAYNMMTDPYFCVPMGSTAVMIKLSLSRAVSRNPSPESASSSLMPLVGSIGFILASLLGVYGFGWVAMDGYVRKSIETDLADIPKLYIQKGGSFLVAQETSTGRIVGIVGGEIKEEKGKFELRRMSVDGLVQCNGIGRRLTSALEERLVKAGCRHLFLTTSSLQVRTSTYV